MISLREKTISGIAWSLLQNIGGRVISFIVMIILTRLLTPEMFGLLAMLSIFIQLSQSLIIAGFNQALIQKKETDDEDYSSVFWINFSVSIFLFTVLYFTAPLIASFYNQPLLTKLTRILCLVFVINSFSFVQETKLNKEMNFKLLSLINIPPVIIGGISGIIAAILDYGVWSIVVMQLVNRLTFVVQIWFFSKWRPQFVFDYIKVKKLFLFGSKLLFSEIIHVIYQNIYLVIIGKLYPVSSVGYYQNASNFINTPSITLSSALNQVAMPVFSSIQDDNKRLKAGYKKIIQQALFWACPIFVLSGVLAEPLFRLVFTEKWLPAVPYFQWLCIVGIFTPLNSFNLNILNVKGRSDLYLKLEIMKKAVITLGIIATVPFGIMALIIFQAVNSVFMYLINSYYSGRFIQYSIKEQLKDILPIFLLCIVLGAIIFLLDKFLVKNSDFLRIIIGYSFGVILYYFSSKYLRLEAFSDFRQIIKL